MARDLWDMIFGLFGIQWMMPRRVVDLLVVCMAECGNIGIALFGVLFHIVCFGVCGRKEMLESSREVNGTS
jgi:hypothetical protein